ncbi:hypothetical protein KIPB_004708 [Kipferlia bialata]|uniref:Uncharacterized protein n=1 Tax=Kipferlia bialata TaxID=797122 RepID=A0A9K3CU79_9EUKA|nr:hypothetical protein KIPB_004708 [Kipferlia bialata]|eukprot:g4708.t1
MRGGSVWFVCVVCVLSVCLGVCRAETRDSVLEISSYAELDALFEHGDIVVVIPFTRPDCPRYSLDDEYLSRYLSLFTEAPGILHDPFPGHIASLSHRCPSGEEGCETTIAHAAINVESITGQRTVFMDRVADRLYHEKDLYLAVVDGLNKRGLMPTETRLLTVAYYHRVWPLIWTHVRQESAKQRMYGSTRLLGGLSSYKGPVVCNPLQGPEQKGLFSLDFRPLLTERVYQLGNKRSIPNERLDSHYRVMACAPPNTLSPVVSLWLAYLLLLMERYI